MFGRVGSLGLSELLFPRLLHVFHDLLIDFHILDYILNVAQAELSQVDTFATSASHCELLQDLLKLGVLFLELTDDLILGALVNHGLVLNLFSSVSVTQCAKGLFVILEGW